MNVVTQIEGEAAAVLIRGVEIVKGIDECSLLRYGKDYQDLTPLQVKNISNGPGKLCKAMGISKSDNGKDLCDSELFICSSIEGIDNPNLEISTSPRIGINYAQEAISFPWRFYVK